MNKSVNFLLITQFATAFADRAIFFILFVLIKQFESSAGWYVPLLQVAFILAYVLFAPWAGTFSDRRPKRNVLIIGNLIKLAGLGVLFLYLIPELTQWAILIGYFIVGFGAVMFSPAKYGLVPELVEEKKLVKINAWLEGGTIVAILSGQFVGAYLGSINVTMALSIAVAIYVVSTLLAFGIKITPVIHKPTEHFIKDFISDFKELLSHHIVRFALLGVSLFWSVAAVLQVLLLEWAGTELNMKNADDLAILGIFIGIGIVFGSVIVPKLITLRNLRNVRYAAYAMGVLVILLSQLTVLDQFYSTYLLNKLSGGFLVAWDLVYILLICIGVAGGILVVPINAALEDAGHKTVGSGGAVAVQRFSENMSMILSLGIYTAVLAAGVSPVWIMACMGIIVLFFTMLIGVKLPARPVMLFEDRK